VVTPERGTGNGKTTTNGIQDWRAVGDGTGYKNKILASQRGENPEVKGGETLGNWTCWPKSGGWKGRRKGKRKN